MQTAITSKPSRPRFKPADAGRTGLPQKTLGMSTNRADDPPRRTPWFEQEDGVLYPEDLAEECEVEGPLEAGDLETVGSVNMGGEEYDWKRFSP